MLKQFVQQGRSKPSPSKGWLECSTCARPTRAFPGRALREHGDHPSYPAIFQHHAKRTVNETSLPLSL
jgi:hypothetical protein